MVTVERAEAIARQMAAGVQYLDEQVAQTLFRMQLVEGWGIPRGARILEVGCGQGDMTAVLADAVGRSGRVTAVDAAGPWYGAPVTLGQSADHLIRSALGRRIEFRFECDLLDPAVTFDADAFDFVVLAHCSWYFGSLGQLRDLLARVHPWAPLLCYSEWDMAPSSPDQVAHLLAVLIQGQVEAHKPRSESNVRTPFSRDRLKRTLCEAGWIPTSEANVDSASLADARWEIAWCLQSSLVEAVDLQMPDRLRELLASEVDTLREVSERGANRSLPSYAIVAARSRPGPDRGVR